MSNDGIVFDIEKECFEYELMQNINEEVDKDRLKVGDVISFHSWEVGGFLFGIIIEQEDEIYHGKLNIWRPGYIYYLQSHGIDGIKIIHSFKGLSMYQSMDLKGLINEAKNSNISVSLLYSE